MPAGRKKESAECKRMKRLIDSGQMGVPEVLAHHCADSSDPSNVKGPSTLYLVKIDSSLGKTPCDSTSKPSTCRLIAKGVIEAGKSVDIYLMNCHYGPPCAFLERLR